MATGTEHYREAEEWLTIASLAGVEAYEQRALAASIAQAHAALALTAAAALALTGVGESDFGVWSELVCEPLDDPYGGMTNADVMSGEELAEYERDGEAYYDALTEAEAAEHADDYQPGDEHDYEPEQDDNEDGEL